LTVECRHDGAEALGIWRTDRFEPNVKLHTLRNLDDMLSTLLETDYLAEWAEESLIWDEAINAAAAVASLPAEEQKSAVLAGKAELKQAAKRVREVNRKLPHESETDSSGLHKDDQDLQERVNALTAENLALRAQVAELQARLMV
jgi:hypothetical protein